MIFVIITVSLLVRSCKFVNNTPPQEHTANPAAAASEQTDAEAGANTSVASLFNGIVDVATGIHLGHNLEKEELDLLINYIANRVWWRSSAQELPVVRNAVADMFAYVATENLEFSHVYIQEMFKAISTSNFMVVKKYERPLLILV